MNNDPACPKPFAAAQFIRTIGRGKEGARNLSQQEARALFGAMFDGEVSDIEVGAVLLAYRIKGESADELAGMLQAVLERMKPIAQPANIPVVIPTYNGARNMPNLTPLLAMLLAREGVPVLLHGGASDPSAAGPARVTTGDVMCAMGLNLSISIADAFDTMSRGLPAFLPIQIIAPHLAWMLGLRRILGVRNSAHTLAKLVQPFEGNALMLCSYTHPEYAALLHEFLINQKSHALLARGTEGESVANARRQTQIDWYRDGSFSLVVQGQTGIVGDMPVLPDSREAVATAMYVQSVLSGELPVPLPIARQVQACMGALGEM